MKNYDAIQTLNEKLQDVLDDLHKLNRLNHDISMTEEDGRVDELLNSSFRAVLDADKSIYKAKEALQSAMKELVAAKAMAQKRRS